MAAKRRRDLIITCPYCGAEYVPCEIYIPKFFIGDPKVIDKDFGGKLESYCEDGVDLNEEYRCDYCGREFDVTALLKFKAYRKPQEDFKEEYSSPLYPPKLILDEGIGEEEV